MTRIFGVALVLAVAAACGRPDPTEPPVLDIEHQQVTYGMNLKLTEAGVLKADLLADTAFSRPGSDVTELRGVELTFFDEEGARPGTLTSRSGEYDQRSGVMTARGAVVLVVPTDDGGTRTIRTEELHYDQKGDAVWSEVPTSIEQKDGTFYAQNFSSDTRFTSIRGNDGRSSGVRVGDGGVRF
jgi:LPS export ABC transporter protein LptC